LFYKWLLANFQLDNRQESDGMSEKQEPNDLFDAPDRPGMLSCAFFSFVTNYTRLGWEIL
jgi:hypothetical protein